MFARLNKKRALALVGGAATAVVAMSACMPANGTPEVLAAAGSDTTQDVMAAVTAEYNADATYNTDPDTLVNVLSVQTAPIVVPADPHCAAKTYHSPPGGGEIVAPNGSSNGRNALKASVQAGDGCIDIARSSGPPRAIGTDLATFEYYAYALDAIGWATASTKAPANMTLTQLRSIYNCTFTDWASVGGTAGTIERYMPQTGSGTYQFFQNDVLGFDPAGFGGGACAPLQYTQENSGEAIDTNGDLQTAIVGYSMANMVAQTRGTAPDQRHGQVMHQLNGQSLIVFPGGVATPNTAGPVVESNVLLNNPAPAYPGIRYVFNVLDSTSKSYFDARRFVGFENSTESGSAASPLCDGTKADTIENFGFGPLAATSGAHNLLGSNCRVYYP